MKTVATAAAAILLAASASAMDLPVPGLALNTDAKVEYKMDAESTALTLAPELSYMPSFVNGVELTGGTILNVWDNTNKFTMDDEFDHMPTLDLGVSYSPAMIENMEFEVGTSYDLEEKERGEVTMSATFSF